MKKKESTPSNIVCPLPHPATEKFGQMTLFFGCRTRAMDLYAEEKEMMKACGVLTHTHLALSREPALPKVCQILQLPCMHYAASYVPNQLLNFAYDIV